MIEDVKNKILTTPTSLHWQKIGINHHHGICVALFSIRSKKSCGIGEFLDLIPLIDWCKQLKMDMIQLLPLNEVYYHDPSPYNALSSCALDPIHLSFSSLPYLSEYQELLKRLPTFKKYNNTKKVAHNEVRKEKFKWLKKYYQQTFDLFKNENSYQIFIQNNSWLKTYATFRFFKDQYQGHPWTQWPIDHQNPTEEFINQFYENNRLELDFFIFLQYLCFSQLSSVKEYASKNLFFLKGDIPILTNPNSVDVWYYKELFDINNTVGVPPDDFNEQGQRWGFPMLKWDVLKNNDYSWWKQRLAAVADLYHMYRIDHAVGFFRMWVIPNNLEPSYGQFVPRDPRSWEKEGKDKLLMLINSSLLLPIAEDLGFIPKAVYQVLKNLGLCGLKIPRWQSPLPMKDYEPLSLTTLSTHDTETLEQWWFLRKKEAQRFCHANKLPYNNLLTSSLRKKILTAAHHSASLFHVNLLQEYLALFPEFVWEKPQDERINVPGKIDNINWTYKLKPSLEDFLTHEDLKKNILEIISGA